MTHYWSLIRRTHLIGLLVLLAVLGSCERKEQRATSSAVKKPAAAKSSAEQLPVLVFLGDSLTAGFGLPQEQSYPSLIAKRLGEAGYAYRVVNAGVSGDTSAGGLSRTDWILRSRPQILVLALGANDSLRGQDPALTEKNLSKIIQRCQQAGTQVLLGGMQTFSNFGKDYARRFAAIYPSLARKHRVPLLPFLLEGIPLNPEYNQPDGIHPNAKGAEIIADNVWRALQPLLKKPSP